MDMQADTDMGSSRKRKREEENEEEEDPIEEDDPIKEASKEDSEEEPEADDDDDDDDGDDEYQPILYAKPRVWYSEPITFDVVIDGNNLGPQKMETETHTETKTEMETEQGDDNNDDGDEEEEEETWDYEGHGFGHTEYWEMQELLSADTTTRCPQPPSKRSSCSWTHVDYAERVRKEDILMDCLRKLAEERTLEMYQSLLNDPVKAEALPDDLREKAKFVVAKKREDPGFRICTFDGDMMEFTFHKSPWFVPYTALQLLRNKENGELVVAGRLFRNFVIFTPGHDEDKDEQLVQLYEILQDYMKNEFPKANLLRTDDRHNVRKLMILHVKREGLAGDKLDGQDILDCVTSIILVAEKMELAEEYHRSKKSLWELCSQKKLGYSHPEVQAKLRKLDSICCGLHPAVGHLEDGWTLLSSESDGEKWMKKIDAERERIKRKIKEAYTIVEYLKLKMMFAKEIGAWNTTFDEFWEGICGDRSSSKE